MVTYTENEVKKQEDKYLRALKEGEKALEEKTCQLARTRSEIQTQMTEFHGLNGKINRLRTEMKELQFNFRKEQEEAYRSSQRRQEEIRKHDVRLKVGYKFCSIIQMCLFTSLKPPDVSSWPSWLRL